jgi:serine/threonine protein kinase
VVDFGIFGSIAGIRMENITCGSLKYMSPELLLGHTQSSPKIDIWALGLMLHGLIFGFLPFNKSERKELEKQIINE